MSQQDAHQRLCTAGKCAIQPQKQSFVELENGTRSTWDKQIIYKEE